jgi:hypothetical protein
MSRRVYHASKCHAACSARVPMLCVVVPCRNCSSYYRTRYLYLCCTYIIIVIQYTAAQHPYSASINITVLLLYSATAVAVVQVLVLRYTIQNISTDII